MNSNHEYGSDRYHFELVDELFTVNNARVLVKQIPARMCENCGELTFSRETTEKVRRMIYGDSKPVSRVEVPVYQYA